MLIKKKVIYLQSKTITTKNNIMELTQVKSKKALENQGLAVIESNDFWQFNEAKYVINIIAKNLIFKQTGTSNYSAKTIKECLWIYNRGLENKK